MTGRYSDPLDLAVRPKHESFGMGRIRAVRCEDCGSLVAEDCTDRHDQAHAKLDSAYAMGRPIG